MTPRAREHRRIWWFWDGLRIGVIGAIAAAVMAAAVSVATRTEKEIAALTDRVGGDLFYVHQAVGSGGFSLEDIAAVQALASVRDVAAQGRNTTLIHSSLEYSLTWLHVSEGYEPLLHLEFLEGGPLTGDPGEAILGYGVKQEIYGQDSAIGEVLSGKRVVGVLKELPDDDTLRKHLNSMILTSRPAAFLGLGRPDPSRFAALIVDPQGDPQGAMAELRTRFNNIHIVPCRDVYAVGMEDGDIALGRLLSAASWVALALSSTLICIAVVLTTLKRLHEIGIRRAVGAGRGDTFLALAGLGVGGAAAGACIGLLALLAVLGLVQGNMDLAFAHLLIVPWVALAGLAGSAGPALWAARVPPVKAILRRGVPLSAGGRASLFLALGVATATATASVVILVNAQSSLSRAVDRMWGDIDDRLILVEANDHSVLPPADLQPDARSLLGTIDGIETVVPLRIRTVAAGQTVAAVGEGFCGLNLLEVVYGVPLLRSDIQGARAACMISERLASRSPETHEIGDVLTVRGIRFTIIGIYSQPPVTHEFAADIVIPDHYGDLLPIARTQFLIHMSKSVDRKTVEETIVDRFSSRYPESASVVLTQVNRQQVVFRFFYSRVAWRLANIAVASVLLASMGLVAFIRLLLVQQMWIYGVRRTMGETRARLATDILRAACLSTLPGLGVGIAAGWLSTPSVLRCVYVLGSAEPAASFLGASLMVLAVAVTAALTSATTIAQEPAALMRARSV